MDAVGNSSRSGMPKKTVFSSMMLVSLTRPLKSIVTKHLTQRILGFSIVKQMFVKCITRFSQKNLTAG